MDPMALATVFDCKPVQVIRLVVTIGRRLAGGMSR
jgi:hypothetical protein